MRPERLESREVSTLESALLACGVLYGLVYVAANDVVAATRYPGYSRTDQAISELSATSAPTRAFLVATLPVQSVLLVAFGVGVWRLADRRAALRVTGSLLIAAAVVGLAWVPFPMTSRGDMATGTVAANDVGHLALAGVTVLLIVTIVVAGAVAVPGRLFRVYSAATLAAVLGFGALSGGQAAAIQAGLPTPWLGLYERINVYGYMLWLAVLALVLLSTARRGITE